MLNDPTEIARKAILANFAARNTRVFTAANRHARICAIRRNQVREWITALRVLRSSAMKEHVRNALKDTGPLMAHDLRRRIILVGLEHRLGNIQGSR